MTDARWLDGVIMRYWKGPSLVIGGHNRSEAATDLDAYIHFRPGFASAMDGRLYNIEYLDDLIRSRKAIIWWTWESAILAEIKEYPTGARVIHGLVATGHLEEIVNDLIPAAEAWGKEQGCIMAIVESRPEWARVLKSSGYEPHQLAVRKEL